MKSNFSLIGILMVFVASFVADAALGGARILGARSYDKDQPAELLFKMARSDDAGGNVVTSVWTNTSGEVAIIERVTLADGKVKKLEMEQKQIDAKGEIVIEGDEIHFSYTKKGKTKTAKEKLENNFVVPMTVVSHLQSHWTELMKGEKVNVRLGVIDRRETVGFQFYKDSEKEVNGKKLIAIKMRPSSFLIAALVKPLYFYFEPDGNKLVQMVGRILPKRKVGDSFKDLDALTIYEY